MCYVIIISVLFWETFLLVSNQSTTSSRIHKRNIESLIQGRSCLTRPLLSLYNSCLQLRNTGCIQRNMKTFNLCILVSLAVAVYCVPISHVTGQDEDFAEVCILALPCSSSMWKLEFIQIS